MTDNGVEQKPSETALFAALRRTIANKEFGTGAFGPDYLAEYFLPSHFRFFLKFKRIQANTRDRLDGFLPGLSEYMIARTAYFDGLFVGAIKAETPQIVLLGAGYDSRAYRFAQLNQGTRIFELDAAPTQERKKQCIQKARIDLPGAVRFVPINFNKQSLEAVLSAAGYQNDRKTLFIWEGVSYYLEADAVDRTLAVFGQNEDKGSSLAFDYTVIVSEDKAGQYYGVKEFYQAMKEQHGSEALMFSIADGQAGSFLEQRGLRLVQHMDNREIEAAFLARENGSLLGHMTAHFRFVQASPG